MTAFVDARSAERTAPPELGDVVRSLAKAEPLLSALRDGPMHKASLADEVGVSKSTVYNWTSELGELGLVTRTADGYRLTRVGRLHVEGFLEFGDASRRIYGLEPVLDELPAELLPPRDLLREGSLVGAGRDPDAPMNELLDLLASADHVAGLLPVVSSRLLAPLRERVADGTLAVDLVVAPAALETLRERHPDALALLAGDGSRLLVADDSFSSGVFRAGTGPTSVGVAAYTGTGHLGAFARFDAGVADEWATAVVERFHDGATPIEPADG